MAPPASISGSGCLAILAAAASLLPVTARAIAVSLNGHDAGAGPIKHTRRKSGLKAGVDPWMTVSSATRLQTFNMKARKRSARERHHEQSSMANHRLDTPGAISTPASYAQGILSTLVPSAAQPMVASFAVALLPGVAMLVLCGMLRMMFPVSGSTSKRLPRGDPFDMLVSISGSNIGQVHYKSTGNDYKQAKDKPENLEKHFQMAFPTLLPVGQSRADVPAPIVAESPALTSGPVHFSLSSPEYYDIGGIDTPTPPTPVTPRSGHSDSPTAASCFD